MTSVFQNASLPDDRPSRLLALDGTHFVTQSHGEDFRGVVTRREMHLAGAF